jgi:hypothetical protein
MPRKNTKSKSQEFRMKLTLGAVLICPHCRRENSLSVYDGDSIPMHEVMPDAETTAGGLALSKDGHCFYACLNACACQSCGAGCHIVDLHIVKTHSEISRDWAEHYFWLNGPAEEPDFSFTASCRGGGLPKRCTVEFTETGAGYLEHYCFGPFISPSNLEGSNGVANCEGGRVWKDAASLILRAWPLISRDVFWPESFTIRGHWPLSEAAGWKPRAENVLPA